MRTISPSCDVTPSPPPSTRSVQAWTWSPTKPGALRLQPPRPDFLEGIEPELAPRRRFSPPAHDQRPRHHRRGWAPGRLGVVGEFRPAPRGGLPTGRNSRRRSRAHTRGQARAERRVPGSARRHRGARSRRARGARAARGRGCGMVTVDEPSMSATPTARTRPGSGRVQPQRRARRRSATSAHICAGNYKARGGEAPVRAHVPA